jgi:O-antigen/teichoic acid export membrane protein
MPPATDLAQRSLTAEAPAATALNGVAPATGHVTPLDDASPADLERAAEVASAIEATTAAELSITPAGPVAGSGQQHQRGSVLRNASVLMGSQVITWSLALVTTVLLPRFVGPTGVGQYRLATSLWAIALVVTAFGTTTAVTVTLAKNATHGFIVGEAFAAQLVLFLVSFATIMGFVFVAGYDRATIEIVVLVGLSSFFAAISATAVAAFYGLERMGPAAKAEIISRVFMVAAVVVLLLAGADIFVIAAFGILSAALSAGILINRLRHLPGVRFWGSPAAIRPLMRRSFPFLVNDASLVLYLQVDTVVISLVATQQEIGWYAAADVIFGSLGFVPVILMTSLFPVLARVHGQDPGALGGLIRRSFGGMMLLAFPIALGTAVMAGPFTRLLYGPEFVEAGPVLAVFGIVLLLTYPTILLGRLATATGRQAFWGWLMLVAVAVSIPVDFVLVPWTSRTWGNGAIGGALAYIVTELLILVVAIWKLMPDLLNGQIRVRLVKCAIAGAAMVACTYPLREQFIAIPIVVGVISYAVATLILRTLTPEEHRIVRHAWSGVVGIIRSRTSKARSLA